MNKLLELTDRSTGYKYAFLVRHIVGLVKATTSLTVKTVEDSYVIYYEDKKELEEKYNKLIGYLNNENNGDKVG